MLGPTGAGTSAARGAVAMGNLRRVGAVYLIAVAVVVAVFFIVNTFLDDTLDVLQVWYVLDVLMLIALAAALIFNYSRKTEVGGRDPEAGVTLRYLEVNVAFYVTAAVTILFSAQLVSRCWPRAGTAWSTTTKQRGRSGRSWIRRCRWWWA